MANNSTHSANLMDDQASSGSSNSYYGSARIFPLETDRSERPVRDARVLIFSQRNVERPVWHGGMYEFEDVITSVEDAQMLAPHRRPGTRAVRLARNLRDSARQRLGLTRLPESEPIHIDGTFDLFFAVFHFTWQVAYLRNVDWRRRCRKGICFVVEQWWPALDEAEPYLEMLREFDQVYLFSRWSIPRIEAASGTAVNYLPIGVDALQSCPYPASPPRTVDVFSMGRRTPHVHDVLVRMMQDERISYVFDSVRAGTDSWINYREHRALLRHLFKRSRFVLAFRHNDSPQFAVRTGGEEAIPSRYFESIAGGPVILGSAPNCSDYHANFDWPDAVIRLPTEPRAIEETLASLNDQPERIARAGVNNTVNALRRHDWAYRWQAILAAAGLSPAPALTDRIAHLQAAAEMASSLMLHA